MIFLAILVNSIGLRAQLKADFSADTLSFCPPYSVRFTDNSTGGTITTRRWNFGQGGTSNTNNSSPSASYVNSGTYSVKLVVSNGSSSDSITKVAYIRAFTLPKVNFGTKEVRTGCAPLSLNFVDSTILGSAPIKSYSWNYGDGFRGNTKNPFHKYLADGTYPVILSVVDTNACIATLNKTSYVKVIKIPKVKFSVTPNPSSCKTPHKVTFVNQSTGTGTLTYLWKFGNGDSSILKNPSYTFGVGSYDITLIAKNGTGCSDSLRISRYITVGAPKADFQVVDTVCLSDTNLFGFKNLSVGANTYLWDFGDGVVSSFKSPSHRYFKTGRFKVRLIIGLATPCSDTMDKYINVIQPIANYTTDKNYWCDDANVIYTPGGTYTSEAKTAIWDLWDWPFKQQYRSNAVPYGSATFLKKKKGKHSDSLTVFYPKWGSCSSKVALQKFEIWRPKGYPLVAPYSGCAPITVKLVDQMFSRDSITVGTWLFDGKNPLVTRSTSKTYTIPGTYKISYSIKHKRLGCLYKYGPFTIEVGKKQKSNFTIDTMKVCLNDTVKFINLSTDTNKIKKYSWNLDWAKRIPFVYDKNPQKHYTDTGYKSVMLIVDNNGCPDTLILDSIVRVVGPTGQFAVEMDCDKPFDRKFTGLSWKNVQRFLYEFGDSISGSTDSINKIASYKYPSRGDYDVKLTLFDDSNGCKEELEAKVYIRVLKLKTSVDKKVGCYPSFFTFKTDSSQDLEAVMTINNGLVKNIVSLKKFSYKTKTKGVHFSTIIGSDINGCADTNIYRLKTYLPIAKFGMNKDSGCVALTINLTDSSITDTTFSSLWWSGSEGNFSKLTNPNFTFNERGKKTIEFFVKDTLGCIGKMSKLVYAFQPWPTISADTQVCAGIPITFTNKNGLSNETHAWNFGDSLLGNGKTSQVIYTKPGKKSIRLTSIDSYGCDSIIDKNLWIEVQKAVLPVVVSEPEDTTCYPADIDFRVKNRDSTVQYYYWRFDSSHAFIRLSGPTAFYNYSRPGVFGVDIVVETTFGCRDTFRIDSILKVGGPYARFDMKDTFCFMDESEFDLKDVFEVYEFRMDFGDGILDTFPSGTKKIRHKYANSGFYPVSLIFTDSIGNCVKSWQDSLFVQEINAKINAIDTAGCSVFRLNVNADKANVDVYEWSVGGDVFSLKQSFSKGFLSPGQYTIVLKPTNTNTGCFGFDSLPFTVFPLPVLSKSGDGLFCYKDSTKAIVSGAEKFQWKPTTYLSTDTMGSVLLLPENDIIYNVVGTNKFGCKSSIDLKFQVIKPPYIESVEDTILFLGQLTQMDQTIAGSWNYKWKPALFLSCSTCPNPELKANRNITYTLTISDDYGCFSLDTSFSVFVRDDYKLFIPNAFTPNKDGLNDNFDFYAEGFKEMEYFRIYTRWGDMVYEFTGMQDSWDGLYNGEPWSGNSALVYKGRFTRYSKEVVDVIGSITLVN